MPALPPAAVLGVGVAAGAAALAAFIRSALRADTDLRRELTVDEYSFVCVLSSLLNPRSSAPSMHLEHAVHRPGARCSEAGVDAACRLKQRWSDALLGLAFAIHVPGWTTGYIKLAGSAEGMAVQAPRVSPYAPWYAP